MSNESATQAAIEADQAHQMLLEARRPLKEEIEKEIAPYIGRKRKPPRYDSNEVAIMAIITSSKEYMTLDEILHWATSTFLNNKELPEDASIHFFQLGTYDIPLITKQSKWDMSVGGIQSYSIPPNVARMGLRKYLEPPRKGVFNFLGLPAEIRNRIYTMLLYYEDAELNVNHVQNQLSMWLECRACATHVADPKRHPAWCHHSCVEGLLNSKVLDLLLVSQKIYAEALPIFYSSNVFLIEHLENSGTLSGLSVKQCKYITKLHIRMYFGFSSLDEVKGWLSRLSAGLRKLTSLEELAFSIEDWGWLRKWVGISVYEDIHELQGLIEPAAKVKTLEFYPLSRSWKRMGDSGVDSEPFGPGDFESFIRKGVQSAD